ncbi:reverse transcriptase [Aspergillus affinis]|uniref:reverse transcriptase n=1 Tax=Aspergillus affinis TaxID=1070780 RepID=UPI0022FE50D7|nr:reverse transcriptase [Aspergillus affinis]KAI9039460.1 reverse transcriptase [Aspergillus affinis]
MATHNSQPGGPLQAALLKTTTAASTRATEGQKIFNPIAAFLDKYRSLPGLAPHQQNALDALSNDLADIAQRHFNAYISGIPLTLTANPPAPAPAPVPLPPSPPPSRPPSGLAQSTYATVTQTTNAKGPTASQPRAKQKTIIPALNQQPDSRLFVRLPPNHLAKNMDAYAIYTSLRSHLGANNKALKGVQSIKTGFALLPLSPEALAALEAQKEAISTFFTTCQIERSSRWISYRVTNIPRKVGQLNASQYSMVPVNPEILSAEVAEATGLTPASVTETAASISGTNTISSSWFINFSEESKVKLPPLIPVLQDVYIAMALTQQTMTNAYSGLASQVLVLQRPNRLRPERPAPHYSLRQGLRANVAPDLPQPLKLEPPGPRKIRIYLLFLQIAACSGQSTLILNIYNAPTPGLSIRPGRAVQELIKLPDSYFIQPILLAGDFNLLYSRWQPSFQRGPSTSAELVSEWLDRSGLVFISEIDIPTHNKGNTLDLTFASSTLALSGASTKIASYLDATSDHRPLLTILPWGPSYPKAQQRLKFNTLDLSRFSNLLTLNVSDLPTTAETEEELDCLANAIISAVYSAYEASALRSRPQGGGQPWWNLECKEALQKYRIGLSTRKDFRREIRRAQQKYWRNKINATTTSKEVFEMSKWHKTTGSYRSPPMKDPLQPDCPPAVDIQEKRDILARNLLQNSAEAGDIPSDTPTVSSRSLPFPGVSMAQAEKAVLHAGNTTPGSDGLPTSILKAAWPLIKNRVLALYQSCLSTGYHPQCFRHAVLAIIQKPNKTDWANPRSYRPIALLSVLGKGLERLIARNMAWIAISYKVLASQQFGALPLRSAVDLTTCLLHDVEQTLNQGKTASLLTFDIKGAFDGVLPGRLVYRLRTQGWPENLVRWVASFITGRTVQIRLDEELGPKIRIFCGLPQGSPISPILFMLYLAPLFWMGNIRARFGYADNGAFLVTSLSLESNAQNI